MRMPLREDWDGGAAIRWLAGRAEWIFPLFLLLFYLLAGGGIQTWAAPKLPLSLKEIKEIQSVRQLRQSPDPQAWAVAAQAYLKDFPRGRYPDEALLALGEAFEALEKPRKALEAYQRLIDNYPDSPFREQAFANSIPALHLIGQEKQASQQMAALKKRYPNSLFGGQAQLSLAKKAFGKDDFPKVVEILKKMGSGDGLSAKGKTEYFRILAWSYLKTGQEKQAWPYFAEYLEREDSWANKAQALMRIGKAQYAGGDFGGALKSYQQVVGSYPDPRYIGEALYRRAELFHKIKLPPPLEKADPSLLLQAITFYGAYLNSGDSDFLAPALKKRAQLLEVSGKKAEALADYERLGGLGGLENGGIDLEIMEAKVRLMTALGRMEEAEVTLRKMISSNAIPQQTRAALVVALASLHYESNDCPAVKADLQPLPVFSNPRQRNRAFFLRGFCRYKLGEWEKASWDLEGLVNDQEYGALVGPPLLESYQKSGQWSRLVNHGENLLASKRIEPSEDLFKILGRGYEELGQPNMMLSSLNRLEKLNPKATQSAEMQFRYGLAEEALGRQDRAEAHYMAVLQSSGKTPGEKPGEKAPGPEYLGALENMQGLLLGQGRFKELARLNQQAAKIMKSPGDIRRLALWRAGHLAAWAASELKAGNNPTAMKKLAASEKILLKKVGKGRDDAEQAKIDSMMVRLYLNWARASEKSDKPARVIKRYQKALKFLPKDDWRGQIEIAYKLDDLYRPGGNFKKRSDLFDGLAPRVTDRALLEKIRLYRVRIHRDWGKDAAKRKKNKLALKIYRQGLDLLKKEEWRQRYEFIAGLGEIYLKTGRYSELTIQYEKILPDLEEKALKEKVNHFLGQVYLVWAKQAKKNKNLKSARIRAHKALDYLPETDWERRLASTILLMEIFNKKKNPEKGAELFAQLIPQLPAGKVRNKYALFLGQHYQEKIKDPEQARKWLILGDGGGNDPISLEAGYRLTGLEIKQKNTKQALKLLENLTARNLKKSKWLIPIHYRLAVVYHQEEKIEKALKHYKIVAGVKSRKMRKLYPKSIDQSKKQAREIKEYLKFREKAGRKIAVPKVKD